MTDESWHYIRASEGSIDLSIDIRPPRVKPPFVEPLDSVDDDGWLITLQKGTTPDDLTESSDSSMSSPTWSLDDCLSSKERLINPVWCTEPAKYAEEYNEEHPYGTKGHMDNNYNWGEEVKEVVLREDFWYEYYNIGSNEIPPNHPDKSLAYNDKERIFVTDYSHMGECPFDNDYFEKFCNGTRLPFEVTWKIWLEIRQQYIDNSFNDEELEERTLWRYAFIMQNSENFRHRMFGYKVMETIFLRRYPPTPYMIFTVCVAKTRMGHFDSVMEWLQFARLYQPNYDKHNKLLEYVKMKVDEPLPGVKRKDRFSVMVIAVCYAIGVGIIQMRWPSWRLNHDPPIDLNDLYGLKKQRAMGMGRPHLIEDYMSGPIPY